jgi:ergothioneine biosynthesis protein EgtB
MSFSLGTRAAQAANLSDDYRRIRGLSRQLAEPLTPEDAALQSTPFASPAKWHLAHTAWFFEEFVLRAADPAHRDFDSRFRHLFNSYYVQVGEAFARDARGLISRPGLDAVLAYRDWVDERVLGILDDPSRATAVYDRIELGLNHEQQHQELMLTDIKHLFSRNPCAPAYATNPTPMREDASQRSPPVHMIEFGGGVRQIGAAPGGFAFDAECPRHRVLLEPFALANRLVTNGEFREFIDDHGYARAELWLADGWAARCREQWNAPLYWSATEPGVHFTLTGLQPLDPAAPVQHVSLYEADAYATWRRRRLPTEAEWETAARSVPLRGGFLESGSWLGAPAPATDASSLQQMYGVAWQWTRSAFAPYPGFRPLHGALGEYNGKFMANQFVLRGGSCVTPTGHVRPSYRNFFYADTRWQFTGIRLAEDRTE